MSEIGDKKDLSERCTAYWQRCNELEAALDAKDKESERRRVGYKLLKERHDTTTATKDRLYRRVDVAEAQIRCHAEEQEQVEAANARLQKRVEELESQMREARQSLRVATGAAALFRIAEALSALEGGEEAKNGREK